MTLADDGTDETEVLKKKGEGKIAVHNDYVQVHTLISLDGARFFYMIVDVRV